MNFEKLEVWKRAARLRADVYKKTAYLKDFGFRDQLTRSSLSVPSNIAEGMTRESNKERLRFLDISRSSLAEARTQIYIDISYIDKNIGAQWINETIELSKMLTALKSKIKFDS